MSTLHPAAAIAALALMTSISAAPAAQALQLLGGDPSCDGLGTCTIDNIDPVVTPIGSETFQIMLRDMMHIEVFDADGFSVFVEWGIGNPNDDPVMVEVDFAFLDMNGAPIGPAIVGFSSTLQSNEGTGNASEPAEAPEGGSFTLHGFEIVLSCDGCDAMTLLDSSEVNLIELSNIDDTSNVGVWVPEPSTAFLLGAGSLLLSSRRRRSRRVAAKPWSSVARDGSVA